MEKSWNCVFLISVGTLNSSVKILGPEIIQLSKKFQLLIKTKIPTNEEVSCFKSLIVLYCIYHANKC